MDSWSEGQITANGIVLHYYRTGGEKPPLVLLHGFTDHGLCWTPVVRELEPYYDCIMPDARGHNRSPDIGEGFSVDLLASDVAELIRALKLECPLILGHSLGAHTAALVAVRYPELVKAVVLEDPPWQYTERPERGPEVEQFVRNWHLAEQAIKARSYEERRAQLQKDNPYWSEKEIHFCATGKDGFNLAIFENGFIEASCDLWTYVPDIACPALLVTAERAVVSSEMARQAVSTWHRGRHAHILDAGHCIRRDQFRLFMDVVTPFLAEQSRTG